MLKLDFIRCDAKEKLQDLIEQEIRIANKKFGEITKKDHNAKVFFFKSYDDFIKERYPKRIPYNLVLANGSQALTSVEDGSLEAKFFLAELKALPKSELNYTPPHEVGHLYLWQDCRHPCDFVEELFIHEVHKDLPADLLVIKAGYVEEGLLNLETNIKFLLELSPAKVISFYNLDVLGEERKEDAYATLLSAAAIYLSAFGKECPAKYKEKLDKITTTFFDKFKKYKFLKEVVKKSKDFVLGDYLSCQKIDELLKAINERPRA